MLKNLRFLPAVEMTNVTNPTFYEGIKDGISKIINGAIKQEELSSICDVVRE